MRNFFASLFGALIGIFLAFFLVFIIVVGMITNAVNSIKQEKPVMLNSSSVLEIRLNHEIKERTLAKPFHFRLAGEDERVFTETVGLNDILADIDHASKDQSIKGIFLNLADISAGTATVESIRGALEKFKPSGKFIVAYATTYTQKAYYLASVADNLYLYPSEGEILWKGLSAQIMFYKNALEKLGVKVQVFRHGRYKSYVEPFILDKMSVDNRLQTKMFLSSIWGDMLNDISVSRHIAASSLNEMADSMTIRSAKDAQKYKFVDSLLYADQVLEKLRTKLGLSANAAISFVGLDDYRETFDLPSGRPSKIAVIYAAGDIVEGYGDDESIGSARISNAIREARLDDNIKAIVLRVNSPGGGALASEVIWREVELAKKVKPLIVSMGDYAASGGYEISCAATEIVAEPTTITGSIGVFGLLPNAQGLLNDKLGITIDTVSTNIHAAAGSLFYPLNSTEAMVLQSTIEDIYHQFISRVADGRKLTVAEVDSIAQGRVWTGRQAIKIGLVDTLGDINLALKIAAKKANISSYSIEEMPNPFNPLHKLLSQFGAADAESRILHEEFGSVYEPIIEISKLLKTKDI
ncbi:MAG TPA: signal peptide peptidase SppA, partial [Bacteroidia bacterium]|nr:signal peptide peptidase SppA [Bacteroidia bacterium]